MLPLDKIKTPAYVADIKKLDKNLQIASDIKSKTGCKIILATKAFSMFSLYPQIAKYLDGTTASGLYEAKLDQEEFNKEIHVYSPAYKDEEMKILSNMADSIYFNSIHQLNKYHHLFKKNQNIGLRINPKISLVKNNSLYDPSSDNSRFGVDIDDIDESILNKVNILHIHNLCENMADDSRRLIEHIDEKMDFALKKVDYLNIGGGHYYSHPDYKQEVLIDAINNIQNKYKIQVIIESGAAVVYDAGYLISEVIDIIENKNGHMFAILDTSATCHMPDVLEVPYRPNIVGDGDFKNSYILGGKSCLTGDIIGKYSFKNKLKIGDKLIFEDMMQYSFVKNNSFNGVELPSLGTFDGTNYKIIKEFGYEDFKNKLS